MPNPKRDRAEEVARAWLGARWGADPSGSPALESLAVSHRRYAAERIEALASAAPMVRKRDVQDWLRAAAEEERNRD